MFNANGTTSDHSAPVLNSGTLTVQKSKPRAFGHKATYLYCVTYYAYIYFSTDTDSHSTMFRLNNLERRKTFQVFLSARACWGGFYIYNINT